MSVNPTNQVSRNRTLRYDAVDTRGIPRVQIQRQEITRLFRTTFLAGLG